MREFSVGGVLGDTIERIRTRFGVHFVYALVPAVLSAALSYIAGRNGVVGAEADPAARLAVVASPLYWISIAVSLLSSGWVTTGIVGSMLDQPTVDGFSGMIPISVHYTLKYLVLFVIWYVLLILGFLLLIVPGLIVVTMFAASVPAMVDRDLGPRAALQESRRLTKGHRIAVFGALVVFVIVLAVPSLALFGIVGFNVTQLTALRETMPLVSFAMTAILSPLYSVIVSAFLVALYARLNGQTGPEILDTFA